MRLEGDLIIVSHFLHREKIQVLTGSPTAQRKAEQTYTWTVKLSLFKLVIKHNTSSSEGSPFKKIVLNLLLSLCISSWPIRPCQRKQIWRIMQPKAGNILDQVS